MNPGRRIVLPATILLGAAAAILGYVGYREAQPDLSLGDTAYKAIGLLVLEYSGPARPPWPLEIARFLGALALGLALLSVLVALARERADRIRIRLFARGHHVVVGLADRGLSLASGLQRGGAQVVVIESDESARAKAGGKGSRLPVIVGDVRDGDSYVDAAAGRANHIFIAPGDDSTNLQALEACLSTIGEPGPTIHVSIDGQLLWRELHRSAITWSGEGGTIEFISLPDRVAARMVEEAAESLSSRIVIWGAGPKATRTAAHAIRWVLLNGDPPSLTLAGPRCEELAAELEESEPWIAANVPIELAAQAAGGDTTTAFVVGLPYADALAGASILADGLAQATIFAEVQTADGLAALSRSGLPTQRIRFVDAEAKVLGSELFEGAARELIARAKHADYVAQDVQRGVSAAENPSIRPWEDLPEALRESNRAFAQSVGARLDDIGAELEPLTGPAPVAEDMLSPDLIEELARIEHERWVTDLERDGWRYRKGDKDPAKKLHPLLVSWDELEEQDREKDRDAIRLLPEAFARVGYELRTRTGCDPARAVVDGNEGQG